MSIRIRGLPHLMFRRAGLSAIHSYYKTTGVRDPIYFIEFTTDAGLVISDYNERELWERILEGLRDARLFEHMLGAASLPGSA